MAATFDPALTTSKDRVRFYLGDVGPAEGQFPFLVSDELIVGVLGLFGLTGAEAAQQIPSECLAAADIADELGAQFARLVDKTNLSLNLSNSQLSAQFKECANRMRAKGGHFVGPDGAQQIAAEMFAGGLTISGKLALNTDPGAVQPDFFKEQFDHPNTGNLDPGDEL